MTEKVLSIPPYICDLITKYAARKLAKILNERLCRKAFIDKIDYQTVAGGTYRANHIIRPWGMGLK